MLNVTRLRSDAILVTKREIRSIALPQPSLSFLEEHNYLFTSPTHATDDNKVKRKLLDFLWKDIVQPVLQELGFYPKKAHPLPRVWWIGVGIMTNAAIHAAGKFKNRGVQVTTLQYCVPSYTSTIR